MNVLITGGTGSLGHVLTESLLDRGDDVTVYSRDELKQWEMSRRFPRARYILGDVRDLARLTESCDGIDRIIHAAALKHAPAIEGCPDEAVRTNVIGTMNMIRAAQCPILGISSDKACAPITAYGSSKLLMERLLVAAGHSAVRLGNIAGSTGSIINYWRELAAQGQPLPLTDDRMTRHWMLPTEAAAFVLRCMTRQAGGEVFVPKTRSFRVVDLWRLIGGNGSDPAPTGRRPGEKLHESMIAPDELVDAYEDVDGYRLKRSASWLMQPDRLPAGFSTSSDKVLMTPDELARELEAV